MKNYSPRKEKIKTRIAELRERFIAFETALDAPSSADLDDPSIEPENNEFLEPVGRASLKKTEQHEEALGRIKNVTYGISHKCGEDVSAERLNAVPVAHLRRGCATLLKG